MTEPDYLQRTRSGYDLTAAMYAERFQAHLHDKPLDRAMLAGRRPHARLRGGDHAQPL